MGKKRKSVATSLDEVDRTMYSTFCSAANSLSQLYTQAMNQQKLSFQAGERHGLVDYVFFVYYEASQKEEKLYQWILRQQEGGSRVNTVDILAHLQTELDCCGEEPSMSPRALPTQNQHSQPTMHLTNSGILVSSGSSGAPSVGQGFHCDQQSKNYVFSNALSSPVRLSLQNYHIAQGGNGFRNNEPTFVQHQNRDSNSYNSNDSSMDMHADSPGNDSTY
ncbi:uncharacterized protein LOC114309739 isoform X1 [Camellia sinensis]|uniref:uncharacterized protein LOC114309739 isoform X1 n=1 Tax=Camellia sinensis TaxID=4442 RepID=UPI001036239D|nr:uncharacterized protein LOC114309739 isoform X1 [Camellia sinensis]